MSKGKSCDDERKREGKAVKVKWKMFFGKKSRNKKQAGMWWRGEEARAASVSLFHHPRIITIFSASTLIVLCNVLFSALSWLFILLVMLRTYFIIFFVACVCFETSGLPGGWAKRISEDVLTCILFFRSGMERWRTFSAGCRFLLKLAETPAGCFFNNRFQGMTERSLIVTSFQLGFSSD